MNEEKIVMMFTDELIPYNNNPRVNDGAVDAVAKSIEEFGFRNPIIVDKNNVIIAGHTRLKASKKLGLKKVPVIVADDLTDEQANALRLVDNKTNELAEWDFARLKDELDKLPSTIDMSAFDFDMEEIDSEVRRLIDDDTDTTEDESPEVDDDNEPVTKLGDIYKLGNHRLMCGDSTNRDDVEKLMNGVKADMMFTDPPYNVSIEKKSKQVLKSKNYSHIENDELPIEDYKEFLNKVFKNANEFLKNDASYYVFSCQGGDSELMMMMMMRENGIKCRHEIIWVKDAPVFSMGRLDYDYKHEPILYGWKEKHNFYRKGEQDKSVWEFKRTANKLHPTMKPIELIANALNNSSKERDIVLDLFGGSGSTLMACEQLNRKCYMLELDPRYCDVIVKRWENFTGKKAEKEN